MGEFLERSLDQILFGSWQHFSLVVQYLVLATLLAVALAVLVCRQEALRGLANGISAVGLTAPSFAPIGLLIVPFGDWMVSQGFISQPQPIHASQHSEGRPKDHPHLPAKPPIIANLA